MEKNISKVFEEVGEKINSFTPPTNYFVFSAGTPFTDEQCIEAFNGTGVVVVDRNYDEWLNGERRKKK